MAPPDVSKLMSAEEARSVGIETMTEAQRQILAGWGMRMFTMGKTVNAAIDVIKYNGRVVLLDDGTRWEVDEIDATTTELWGPGDKVVIIDDEMYRLDDLEKASVQRE